METYAKNEAEQRNVDADMLLQIFKKIILDIRLPYNDVREPMLVMNNETCFGLLTGETGYTLRPGTEVSGIISKIDEYRANFKSEGGYGVQVSSRNMPSKGKNGEPNMWQLSDYEKSQMNEADLEFDPHKLLAEGEHVRGVVVDVKYDHYVVEVSLADRDIQFLNAKPSALHKQYNELGKRPASIPPISEYFSHEDADKDWEVRSARLQQSASYLRQQQASLQGGDGAGNEDGTAPNVVTPTSQQPQNVAPGAKFNTRNCLHPVFRNAGYKLVAKELDDRFMEQGNDAIGSVLIHPNSRKSNYLTLTWAVARGVYRNWEIQEKNKLNQRTIGEQLFIKR